MRGRNNMRGPWAVGTGFLSGVAGSGKTVLLLSRARYLAMAGSGAADAAAVLQQGAGGVAAGEDGGLPRGDSEAFRWLGQGYAADATQ